MTVLHIRFPNQYELTSIFLRLQEYYESPQFRNTIFTHEEYFNWYAQENGKMSYFSDWNGFNLPDYAFDRFFAGDFNPLWQCETKLLNLLTNMQLKRPFYVIGTWRDNELAHEIIHGLYYTDEQYKKQVDLIINGVSGVNRKVYEPLKVSILRYYNQSVLIDEINAYSLNVPATWMDWKATATLDVIAPATRFVFMTHFNNMTPILDNLRELITEIKW